MQTRVYRAGSYGMPMGPERVIQAEPIRLPVETIRIPAEASRMVPLAEKCMSKGIGRAGDGDPATPSELQSAANQIGI